MTRVALDKGEVGDRLRPHLKIKSHLKIFKGPYWNVSIYLYIQKLKRPIYLKQGFKLSLIIIYFSNPSM